MALTKMRTCDFCKSVMPEKKALHVTLELPEGKLLLSLERMVMTNLPTGQPEKLYIVPDVCHQCLANYFAKGTFQLHTEKPTLKPVTLKSAGSVYEEGDDEDEDDEDDEES